MLKLTGETVTISANDNQAEIKSAGTKYNLLVFDAKDFPKIKIEENLQTFNFAQKDFRNLIKKSEFAAAKENGISRPIFEGVLFSFEDEKLTLAGTNTHRLATISTPITFEGFKKYIVPAKSLWQISTMLGEGAIKVSFSDKRAFFVFENILVTTRLITGDFPPFDKVFPKESTTVAQVETQEFLNALERVAVISKETDYNFVEMKFEGGKLKISSTSPDVGKAEEFVNGEVTGEDLNISFNVDYLTDVLKVIDAEKVQIGLTESLKPAEINALDDESFRYVVTPIRRN